MLEMCIGIFIRHDGQRICLHHVNQCRLEFKVSISHRCGWSSRDIGVGGSGELVDRPLDHWCWRGVVYEIDGVRLLIREKLLRDDDTGSHSPHKWIKIVVKSGRYIETCHALLCIHESRARVNPLKIAVHRTLIVLSRCLNIILYLLPPQQWRQKY
jgi:hypothetical protein